MIVLVVVLAVVLPLKLSLFLRPFCPAFTFPFIPRYHIRKRKFERNGVGMRSGYHIWNMQGTHISKCLPQSTTHQQKRTASADAKKSRNVVPPKEHQLLTTLKLVIRWYIVLTAHNRPFLSASNPTRSTLHKNGKSAARVAITSENGKSSGHEKPATMGGSIRSISLFSLAVYFRFFAR